jgi:peptidoglycan-N-acetylglucosamine deacetylase
MRYTPFIANGTHRRRAIALTFDDGPGPYTPAIIRILVRMHASATFFVVGQELHDFSGALRSEIRHGFVIGDHTQNHAWLIHLNAHGQASQIDAVARELTRYGAPAPRLFRPPYGAFNGETMRTLHRVGLFMVLWSIDPSDWRRPGTGEIVSNVLRHSRPGAVVIMHDGGGDRSQTVAALPAIINGLRKRHYGLVTVPRLLKLDPPPRHQTPPHLSGV